ncbi:acetolactate synthase, large subunit, biosynthetic type [Candidatus Bathyarchaeota archaeon B24-2]|nr:MAG: acetolactate synthase, large subunit, biosynthetic type [Candidatus Bathyarchaeota archaeon B24-2]
MSGAEALVKALEKEGVKHIFGIPGGATLPIYDVLYDSDIRHILVRHEQAAAHAADGYARVSGRPGVCFATSGPGATNLVTGITNAYMDSVPIVAFTGQVPTSWIGKDAFQEADIVGITTPITKHNFQVQKASDIPRTVKMAFYIATSGRPGPVLVDLPKDIQIDHAEMEFDDEISLRGYKPTYEPHPIQVRRAAELLANAEKPMIIAGGGVIASNASEELIRLSEKILAPVATTLMGKGAIPEDHPLALGQLGMHGTLAANKLILEADVLLCVGMRFSDRTTGDPKKFCPDAKIIHVDIDSSEIDKNIKCYLPIVGDAKLTLHAINEALNVVLKEKRTEWMRKVKEFKAQWESSVKEGFTPPYLMKVLREILPKDAIVATEVGQNQMWAALYFKSYLPRTFVSSGGLGTMGFGFPAAIGAKVARPDRIVVDIAGDGSFMMNYPNLACAVSENIPVIIIVLNNSVLGMVAQWQRLFYGRRYSQVHLGGVPDFVKLAEAHGAQGLRAETVEEFRKAVKQAIESDVVTVIDVPISPEENVFPMIPAGKSYEDMIVEGS